MNKNKAYLTVALTLATFLAAVEGTIVTMATPTIAIDLHGFDLISLVFSIYLLTTAISTPVYGKLADLYGRKNVLSIGIIIFLIGSFLCGLAQNMILLVVFRAVQGLGAGAIFTVSFTIIGDFYTLEERSKIQGILNTVWGVASVIGPFTGGFLIDTLSWHWIFFINIPFGLLAVMLLQRSFQESFEKKKHKLDYSGIITLSFAVIAFLSIFLSDQSLNGNNHLFITFAVIITVIMGAVFYNTEKRAREPLIPFDIFTKKSIVINMISLLTTAILMGIEVYIPIYLQNVLGYSPSISGLVMLPMSVAWLLISYVLGNLISKYGEKKVIILCNAVLILCTALLATLRIDSPIELVLIYGFLIGISFGGVSTTIVLLVQDSVDYSRRGTAVAANSLLRTLGQTIGISIFGNIFNRHITNYFMKQGINDVNPGNLYQDSISQSLIPQEHIKLSLNSSLHLLFLVFIIIAFISLFLAVILPGIKKDTLKIKESKNVE